MIQSGITGGRIGAKGIDRRNTVHSGQRNNADRVHALFEIGESAHIYTLRPWCRIRPANLRDRGFPYGLFLMLYIYSPCHTHDIFFGKILERSEGRCVG